MPSNPKNTVSTVIPGPRVRILLPPVESPPFDALDAHASGVGPRLWNGLLPLCAVKLR